MTRWALLLVLPVACGGAVAPGDHVDRSAIGSPEPAHHTHADAPALPQIRCAIPDGRTITCSVNGIGLPDGVSGIEDERTGEHCTGLSWVAPYAGHCATGTACEVIVARDSSGKPGYIEGVCE